MNSDNDESMSTGDRRLVDGCSRGRREVHRRCCEAFFVVPHSMKMDAEGDGLDNTTTGYITLDTDR